MNYLDWSRVKLIALDFDGVMTDGRVIVGTDGIESVVCSHADGQGIETIEKNGPHVVVISGQKSGYVDARCQKMKIDFFRGEKNKPERLRAYLAEKHPDISLSQVCFVGDDRSDLEVMKIVGFPVAVANATDEIKNLAKWVTSQSGGAGAVREVCDLLMASRDDQAGVTLAKRILITGTGELTKPETATVVEETAYLLARRGHTILTNSGRNGVPAAAAAGVKHARANNFKGSSVAYAYMPGLTAEACGTTNICYFDSFEVRNGAICRDADVAVFFQGGFGTLAKLFLLLQRQTHINGLLADKGLERLVRPKQIILHHSFAPTSDDVSAILGRTISAKHHQALTLATTPGQIADLIG